MEYLWEKYLPGALAKQSKYRQDNWGAVSIKYSLLKIPWNILPLLIVVACLSELEPCGWLKSKLLLLRSSSHHEVMMIMR